MASVTCSDNRSAVITADGRNLVLAVPEFGQLTMENFHVVRSQFNHRRSWEPLHFGGMLVDQVLDDAWVELELKIQSRSTVYCETISPELDPRVLAASQLTVMQLLKLVNEKVKAR